MELNDRTVIAYRFFYFFLLFIYAFSFDNCVEDQKTFQRAFICGPEKSHKRKRQAREERLVDHIKKLLQTAQQKRLLLCLWLYTALLTLTSFLATDPVRCFDEKLSLMLRLSTIVLMKKVLSKFKWLSQSRCMTCCYGGRDYDFILLLFSFSIRLVLGWKTF